MPAMLRRLLIPLLLTLPLTALVQAQTAPVLRCRFEPEPARIDPLTEATFILELEIDQSQPIGRLDVTLRYPTAIVEFRDQEADEEGFNLRIGDQLQSAAFLVEQNSIDTVTGEIRFTVSRSEGEPLPAGRVELARAILLGVREEVATINFDEVNVADFAGTAITADTEGCFLTIGSAEAPTATFTPTSTITPTQTITATQTVTPTATLAADQTPTDTPTATATVQSALPSPTPTFTFTPAPADTATATPTPTQTLTTTDTISPTATPSPTVVIATPTPDADQAAQQQQQSPLETPTFTPTFTPTTALAPDVVETPTPEQTPAETPTPTPTTFEVLSPPQIDEDALAELGATPPAALAREVADRGSTDRREDRSARDVIAVDQPPLVEQTPPRVLFLGLGWLALLGGTVLGLMAWRLRRS